MRFVYAQTRAKEITAKEKHGSRMSREDNPSLIDIDVTYL